MFSLLRLGARGVLVGLASVLLVPRLWAEPLEALVLLAEVLWLAFFLQQGPSQQLRRERGDVVLADVLFWFALAIPLDALISGVIATIDLYKALDLSFLQAVNGSFNAALAYSLFVLIRVAKATRDPARSYSLQGLILISVLGLTLLSGLLTLSLSVRQLDRQLIEGQLVRFRQLALTSTILQADALRDLSGLRRLQVSPVDLQVLDPSGRILYSSNPALFTTLSTVYIESSSAESQPSQLAEPLDLLIPRDAERSSRSAVRGYWRYQSKDDPLPMLEKGWKVVVVEPARAGIRELENQSSAAIRLLALILLLGMLAAHLIARQLVLPFPRLTVPRPLGFGDDPSSTAAGPAPAPEAVDPEPLHTGLLELQPLLQALNSREEVLGDLRESLRRSERQRQRLEAEVSRLNIIDPLTGCFNRRELYRRLDHELRMSGREQRPLSFLSLEIDHLRHIQDSYGREVSEEVLTRVALELRHRSRATDVLSRLGPEQFGLLLAACDVDSATKVAALLSDVVRSLEIRHEGAILAVTLSVGVATLLAGRDDPDSLITRAQSALYRAKSEGRDRVVVV